MSDSRCVVCGGRGVIVVQPDVLPLAQTTGANRASMSRVFPGDQQMTFDLRQLTLDELAQSGEADPKTIGKALSAQIDDSELRACVDLLLPDYVRTCFRASGGLAHGTPPAAPSSPRWDQAATSYTRLLGLRIFTGEQWKLLKDLTHKECFAAAESRFDQAKACTVEGERFQALGKAVQKAKATSVAELPEDVVLGVWA